MTTPENIKVADDVDHRTELDIMVMCKILAIHYDALTRTGRFTLYPGHCTDMNGAIKLFQRLDPDVQCVIDGDTYFIKEGSQWAAYRNPTHPITHNSMIKRGG